jgi:hypothetical protein
MSELSIEDQSVLMNFALNGTNSSNDIGVTNDQSVNQTNTFIQNEISITKLQSIETPVYTCISINLIAITKYVCDKFIFYNSQKKE